MYISHNYIGHAYEGHDHIDRDYAGHNYIGQDYRDGDYAGHDYAGHNYVCVEVIVSTWAHVRVQSFHGCVCGTHAYVHVCIWPCTR